MNDDRDEDTGKFTEKYDRDDFLTALRDLGGAAGTSDVADRVGCPQRTAHHKLDQLAEEDRVVKDKVGAAALWRLPEE